MFCAIRGDVLATEENCLNKGNECVWSSIRLPQSQKLYLDSFYRPAGAPLEHIKHLEESLTELHTKCMRIHPHAIIAGDFNVGDIAWDTDEVCATCGSANARKLVAIKEQFSLTQHQREITRPSSNAVLDLVFSTNPNLVSRIEVVPGMSDHLAVLTTLDVRPKQHSNKLSHTVYKYKSANFEGLRADMAAYAAMFLMENPTSRTTEENWKSFKSALHQAIIKQVPTTKSKTKRHLPWITRNIKCEIRKKDRQYRKAMFLMENPTSRTTEENWKSFKSALHQAIIKQVPTTKSKTKRHLPWITRNIKCEIRKKDRQYRKARKSKKHEDWSAYRIKRQQLQKLLRSAHDDYIRNVIGASLFARGNQKKCWSFVKLNRTENVGIPILSDTNGLHITNQAKTECLDTQFVSVFTSDDGKHLPDKGLSPYREMDTIQFTQPGIEILLKNIDQTKATGPDELPARILKETAKEIAGVLSVIFQQSYEEGTVPSDWLT